MYGSSEDTSDAQKKRKFYGLSESNRRLAKGTSGNKEMDRPIETTREQHMADLKKRQENYRNKKSQYNAKRRETYHKKRDNPLFLEKRRQQWAIKKDLHNRRRRELRKGRKPALVVGDTQKKDPILERKKVLKKAHQKYYHANKAKILVQQKRYRDNRFTKEMETLLCHSKDLVYRFKNEAQKLVPTMSADDFVVFLCSAASDASQLMKTDRKACVSNAKNNKRQKDMELFKFVPAENEHPDDKKSFDIAITNSFQKTHGEGSTDFVDNETIGNDNVHESNKQKAKSIDAFGICLSDVIQKTQVKFREVCDERIRWFNSTGIRDDSSYWLPNPVCPKTQPYFQFTIDHNILSTSNDYESLDIEQQLLWTPESTNMIKRKEKKSELQRRNSTNY